jgi:hypothetical protein
MPVALKEAELASEGSAPADTLRRAMRSFPESASQFLTEKHCEFEDKIMRISSTDVIEGSHVLTFSIRSAR